MNIQALISTMHQTDHALINRMNIQTDAIIINQCSINKFEEFKMNKNSIRFISLDERGIGLSRNNALMRATADLILFSDDDVVYVDECKKLILSAFEENPKADVMVFNVPSTNMERPTYIIPKKSRVRWFNCQRYGAVKMVAKTYMLKRSNIYFSLLFGGGAKYSSGEDSLFIMECIRKGLKVYANPTIIGYVNQESSTWFQGYTDKYFTDKGALYYCLSKRWSKLLCLQFVFRHYKLFKNNKTWREALKLMIAGVTLFTKKDSLN